MSSLREWLPLRHRDDPATHRELQWSADAPGCPTGLEIEWLGTAGFRLTHDDTTIVIDPYVTRRDARSLFGTRPLSGDPAAVDRWITRADAVLVGHTHFDHAVDVPILAARGATVYGSASVRQLLRLNDLAERAVVVDAHRRYEIGPFTVTFVPSLHSRLVAGLAVPFDGELTCDHLDGLGAGRFRCGRVWGIRIEIDGTVLYHQGSANLIDDEVPDDGVDIFLCGIAGRMFTPKYLSRILGRLDPSLVVAHHHDDFFRPLDADMGFSFNVNLGGFVEDMASVAPGVEVVTMTHGRPIGGGRSDDDIATDGARATEVGDTDGRT